MLEDYHVKPATVDRVRASWLAPQIDSYLGLAGSDISATLFLCELWELYIKKFVSQWLR